MANIMGLRVQEQSRINRFPVSLGVASVSALLAVVICCYHGGEVQGSGGAASLIDRRTGIESLMVKVVRDETNPPEQTCRLSVE